MAQSSKKKSDRMRLPKRLVNQALLLSVCLLFSFTMVAQKFEWGTMLSESRSSEPEFFSLHENSIIWGVNDCGGEFTTTNPNSAGASVPSYFNNSSVLFSLNLDGQYEWHTLFSNDVTVEALDHAPNGDLMVVVKLEGSDENEKGEYVGYLQYRDDRQLPEGYHIIIISKTGEIQQRIYCKGWNYEEMEVHQIRKSGDNYIVCGEISEGPVVKGISDAPQYAGGDFLLSMDESGTAKWAKVVTYLADQCCSRVIPRTFLEVDDKGAIYLAGAYQVGAIFDENNRSLAPQSYLFEKNNQRASESYLGSYEANGKLRWVQTSKNKGRVSAMTIDQNKDMVYFGYCPNDASSFGTTVETTDTIPSVLAGFSTKGKLLWQQPLMLKTVSSIATNNNGNVVLLGEKPKGIYKDLEYEKTTVTRLDHSLLITTTSKGNVSEVLPFNLTINDNVPYLLQTDKNGNNYLFGDQFCSLKLGMKMLDKNFPDVSCYGSVPFIAKLKGE